MLCPVSDLCVRWVQSTVVSCRGSAVHVMCVIGGLLFVCAAHFAAVREKIRFVDWSGLMGSS